jgi:NADPH:quinone reductase-like Zn-dependent oxidoreductase
LTALGADIVVGEDDPDVVKNTLAQLDGKRPLLASNAVGGESALRLMDMLAPGGSMVTFGAMSKKSIKVPNGFLIFKGIKLEGLWVTKWLQTAPKAEIEYAYTRLAQMMADGTLVQAVDSQFPLSDIKHAVEKAQEEFRNGKIVLNISAL